MCVCMRVCGLPGDGCPELQSSGSFLWPPELHGEAPRAAEGGSGGSRQRLAEPTLGGLCEGPCARSWHLMGQPHLSSPPLPPGCEVGPPAGASPESPPEMKCLLPRRILDNRPRARLFHNLFRQVSVLPASVPPPGRSRFDEIASEASSGSLTPPPFRLDDVGGRRHRLEAWTLTVPFKCHRLHLPSHYSNDLHVLRFMLNTDVAECAPPQGSRFSV